MGNLYLPSTYEMSLADQAAILELSCGFDERQELGQEGDKLDNTLRSKRISCQSELDTRGALELVKRVGIGAAKIIVSESNPARCIVLCGPGNNGADGIALAGELSRAGVIVSIVIVDSLNYSGPLSAMLIQLSDKLGANKYIYRSKENEKDSCCAAERKEGANFVNRRGLESTLKDADIVIDCLLGIGQRGDLRGQVREMVEVLVSTVDRSKIVSIDVPTGVNSDTGEVYDLCVKAFMTIAIQSIKRGLTQYPAKCVLGDLRLLDIGIKFNSRTEFILIDDEQAALWSAPRKPNVNKGDLGTVLVVAGSVSMPGAASLVCLGALHSGAGLVIKAEPKMERYPDVPPEVIIKPLTCKAEFGGKALEEIAAVLPKVSAVVLGPGIGVSKSTERFVLELVIELERLSKSVVIDADALNILATNTPAINLKHAVLTPHPKEAARLLKSDVSQIERDRFGAIKQIQQLFGGTVLLKGASTIIWNGVEGVVNTIGTPALATAGSGDVLAGLIASLMAQGYPPLKAAALGAYHHGAAGIKLSRITGGSITASALAPHLAPAAKM